MFYVDKKVDDKYAIVDTEDGVSELYSVEELKEYLVSGVHIHGVVALNSDKCITMPVGKLINLTKVDMARNKVVFGTATGIKGFDIGIKDGNGSIVALPLSEEFYKYAELVAEENIFILQIPEIVTELDGGFFSAVSKLDIKKYNVNFLLELPSTMTSILSESVYNTKVVRVQFNNKIDKLYSNVDSKPIFINLLIDDSDDSLDVRHIGARSLHLNNRRRICLPSTEILETDSIIRSFYSSYSSACTFYLGDCIRYIGNFHITSDIFIHYSKDSEDTSRMLMRDPDIIYLSDDCNLKEIDMYYEGRDHLFYSSYIFVISYYEYKRLEEVFRNARIDDRTVVGVLCYRTEDECIDIQLNMRDYCADYKSYFSSYFTEDDFGKVKELKWNKYKSIK